MSDKRLNTPNETTSPLSPRRALQRFDLGAIAGLLLLAVPLTYSAEVPHNGLSVAVAVALCGLCGVLSVVWGEAFLDRIARMLDDTGL